MRSFNRLNGEHWLLLAGFLGVIGIQIGTLGDGWHHVKTPTFIGTTLVQISIMLRSFFTDKAN